MNISPLKPIPVSYVVLPTDNTTYYVQAVLRDTASGAILQTINLKQNPTYTYRYTGQFNPVPDTSGLGRYIDITVIPYTDSGYTTPSQNYAALLLNYVVLQPWIPSLGAGGGGSIDYKKLRAEIATLIDEKLYGSTKDIKKGIGKIPVIEYERIEDMMRTVVSEVSFSDEFKGIQSLMREVVQDMQAKSVERHSRAIENMNRIEQRIYAMEERGVISSQSQQNKLVELLEGSKKEILGAHEELGNRIGKGYKDSSEEMLGGFKQFLTDNLSEKEVKIRLGDLPREKKGNKTEFDPLVNKILGL